MRSSMVVALVLSAVIAVTLGKAQYQYPGGYFLPRGYPLMAAQQPQADGRVFFGVFSTYTLTTSTTTITSFATAVTTCTTSTATLTTCTAGRRRRELFGDDATETRHRRGLLYNEEEGFVAEAEAAAAPAEGETSRNVRQSIIPFALQPVSSYYTPELSLDMPVPGSPTIMSRAYFVLGLATTTVTSTTTSTATLTAACASTTGFSTCSGTGK